MRRMLLVVLVVLGLASTATLGHAAVLGVGAGSMTTVSAADRCSGETVTATAGTVSGGTSTSVVLTFPAACQGTTGQLRLVGASGALATTDTDVTLPASGTTVTVTGVPTYTATAVVDLALHLDGWGMATQWSYTAPVPTSTCTVVNQNGQAVGNKPCSVTPLRSDHWGPVGDRRANVYVSFSPTGVDGKQRIAFEIDLSTVPGLPSNWVWGTSASIASGDNITAATDYACSEMPVLRGETSPGWGSYTNVYFQITENRATTGGLSCS